MNRSIAMAVGFGTLILQFCAGCGNQQPVAKTGPAPAAPAMPGSAPGQLVPGQPPATSGAVPGVTPPGSPPAQPAVPAAPIKITAEELCKEIAKDPAAATTKYWERKITVDGYVYYLGEGNKGVYRVVKLQGADNLVIDVGYMEPGTKLRYGQRATFSGTLAYHHQHTPCPMLFEPKFVSVEPYVKPEKPLAFFASYTTDELLKDAAQGKDAMIKKLLIKPGREMELPFLKSLIVEGTIAKITPPVDEALSWELILNSSDGSGQIQCQLDDESASSLKPDQKVTVVGIYDLPPVPGAPVTMRMCQVY